MVKLFREKISPEADAIEAELKDMLFAFDRVVIDPAQASKQFGAEHSLPIITNNEMIVSGEEIPGYVDQLRKLMRDWQKFQVDSCYGDEDGDTR